MKFFRRSSPEQPPENASFVPLDEIWPEIEALSGMLQEAEGRFPLRGGTMLSSFDLEGYDAEGNSCTQLVMVGYKADNPLYFKFSVMDNGIASVVDFYEDPDPAKANQWVFKIYEAEVDLERQGAMLKAGIVGGRDISELSDSPIVVPNQQDTEKLIELFLGYSEELTSRGY